MVEPHTRRVFVNERTESTGTGGPLELEDTLLLAAVVLLPWAFGGVEIWAYRAAALVIVAAASVCSWKRGWSGLGLRRGDGWLLPAVLLAVWAALQLVPLPPAAIRVISPEAFRLYANALPGYDGSPVGDPLAAIETRALERVPTAAGRPMPPDPVRTIVLTAPPCLERRWRSISVQPSVTQDRLLWYVPLLLAFLLVRDRVAHRRRLGIYRWAVFGLLAALAVFALIQLATWNGRIYWIRRVLTIAMPFGPFYNPTNLAGLMEIGVPALAGYTWSLVRRRGRAAPYEARFFAAAVGAVACLVAVFASASKLAVLLVAAGLVALGLLCAPTVRARIAVLVATAAVSGLAFFALAGTYLGQRFEVFLGRSQDAFILEGRLVVWRAALEMFRDFPVTGAGFGTFREVFQRYVPAGAALRWSTAHNDYLELLLDGGLVAVVLVAWLAVGYVRRAIPRLRTPGAGLSPARVGLAIGVSLLAVHAFFDFNHQIPADALVWVACCALLLAPSSSGKRTERS